MPALYDDADADNEAGDNDDDAADDDEVDDYAHDDGDVVQNGGRHFVNNCALPGYSLSTRK